MKKLRQEKSILNNFHHQIQSNGNFFIYFGGILWSLLILMHIYTRFLGTIHESSVTKCPVDIQKNVYIETPSHEELETARFEPRSARIVVCCSTIWATVLRYQMETLMECNNKLFENPCWNKLSCVIKTCLKIRITILSTKIWYRSLIKQELQTSFLPLHSSCLLFTVVNR